MSIVFQNIPSLLVIDKMFSVGILLKSCLFYCNIFNLINHGK